LSNPARDAFAAHARIETIVAQLLLQRDGAGWELRHVIDVNRAAGDLRKVSVQDLRELAQWTERGAFRPLKSAPNLRAGWRCSVANATDLESALNRLYPGFLTDWYAARGTTLPITNYREFTQRQTGMYRVTQHLTDRQAGEAIRACCHPKFCLKQRLWTVAGLPADRAQTKSLIPCLEPCPVMLEFARTAARLEKAERTEAAEQESRLAACTDIREADFSAPENPRRIQLALEKMESSLHADH
jgi:hypothetical protein